MISVIIPTKDRLDLLQQTLQFAREAIANYESEIIVVNDDEKSLHLPGELLSCITLVNNPKQGVASARNYGASVAKGEWLLFLDDDIIISEKNINDAINLIQKSELACVNINWTYPPELMQKCRQSQFGRFLIRYGFTAFKGWYRNAYWSDDNVFESDAVTSQFLLINAATFGMIGGYNESFPFAGFEDYDLSQRLKQDDIRILIQPLTMCYHNEGDRGDIYLWLARRKRGGQTRKVAVNIGYQELSIKYSAAKSGIYKLVLKYRELFFMLLTYIPNLKLFDKLYFFVVNLLYGAYVYEGYCHIRINQSPH